MTYSKNETIVIHSFSVVPPLSMEEFEQLSSFAWEKGIGLACQVDHENGPTVPLVMVLYGDWRLVEKELKRLGRDLHEPAAVRFDSTTGEVVALRHTMGRN